MNRARLDSHAQISRPARLFVVVDSYEAMIRSDVAYRAARSHDEAYQEALELAGRRYDPERIAVLRTLDGARWRAVAQDEAAALGDRAAAAIR